MPRRSALPVLACLLTVAGLSCRDEVTPEPAAVERPADYIDPKIATGGLGFRITSGNPGAAAPNGMVKVSPHTNGSWGTAPFLHYTGYWSEDDRIRGFAHVHLHGTGAAGLGNLAFMPAEAFDATRTKPDGYESYFQKSSEKATPGFYGVTLDRGNIQVEITSTTRAAHHRYTYAAGASEGFVILDLAKGLYGGRVEDASLVFDRENQRFRGVLRSRGQMSNARGDRIWFEARTKQKWTDTKVWADGAAPVDGASVEGDVIGGVLRFPVTGEPIEIQIGLSFVSAEGAAANLAAELPDWAFAQTRAATETAWNELASAVKVFGGTDKQRRIFYSGIYHSFLMPAIYSDGDGKYPGHDGNSHVASGFRYMSDLSLWDTYRTVHPLYSLLFPREARDVVMSLHAMARDGNNGFPRWPLASGETGVMLGAPADIVLADAYLKGITDFDVADLYERLRAAALDAEPATGRGARTGGDYLTLGYKPWPGGRPASLTIELNHADYALGLMAQKLGKTEDAARLLERRKGWRKLWHAESGFLWAIDSAGNLRSHGSDDEFDPLFWYEDEFAEASAWQTLFGPQHDVDGLIELHGGKAPFLAKLTTFMEESKKLRDAIDPEDPIGWALPYSWYEHGNEPSIHVAYMFAQAGKPSLTQKWVRWVMESDYDDAPAGLPGNDDGGTLSSWYVFSALGLYPIAGSDLYVVGAPLFPKVEFKVPGGVFTITAEGATEGHIYVQSVKINGAPLNVAEVRHADLKAGGSLAFVLGPNPSTWGER